MGKRNLKAEVIMHGKIEEEGKGGRRGKGKREEERGDA